MFWECSPTPEAGGGFSDFREHPAGNGRGAGDPATLVATAPLALLHQGLILEDPGDPEILVSTGAGCDAEAQHP